jgi:hypothetical protein
LVAAELFNVAPVNPASTDTRIISLFIRLFTVVLGLQQIRSLPHLTPRARRVSPSLGKASGLPRIASDPSHNFVSTLAPRLQRMPT